jgi:hypothetical protein
MEKREYLLNLIHSHLGSIGGVDGIELSNQDYVNSKIIGIIGSLAKVNSPHVGDAYKNYKTKTEIMMGHGFHGTLLSHEEFIERIKTDDEFAKMWVSYIYEAITDVMKQLKKDYRIYED